MYKYNKGGLKIKLKVSTVNIRIKRSGLRVFNSKVFSLASLLNISEFLWYVNPGIKHYLHPLQIYGLLLLLLDIKHSRLTVSTQKLRSSKLKDLNLRCLRFLGSQGRYLQTCLYKCPECYCSSIIHERFFNCPITATCCIK